MARIKLNPADFVVEEVALYAPTGEGAFTLARVRKEGVTTEEVARRWSRRLGIESSQVGFAGRKDRRSISDQWLSVPGWWPDLGDQVDDDRVEVLEVARSHHRLRPGDLEANRFRVVIRDLAPGEAAEAVERLATLRNRGLVNRFGVQRFGKDAGNAEAGRRVLEGELRQGSSRQRRFLVSAFQAELFNRFIERRPVPPHTLMLGDLAILHSNGRQRRIADPIADQAFADRLELSPTGPIYGAKMRSPSGAPGQLERELWAEQALPEWTRPRLPRNLVPSGARRPLRVPIEELGYELHEEGLEVRFRLPPGSYATVLIDSLFDEPVQDGERDC